MARLGGADLVRRHPDGVHDALVQLAFGMMGEDAPTKGKPQISRIGSVECQR